MPCTLATPSRASTCISAQPDRAEDHELDEVGAAVALALQQRARRGRAVDHHRPERQQAERRGQQDALLERLRRSRGFAHVRPFLGLWTFGAPRGCWHPGSLRRRRAEACSGARADRCRDREALAASFVVGELVEARAGRGEQHDLAGRRRGAGRGHGALQLAAVVHRDVAVRQRARRSAGASSPIR